MKIAVASRDGISVAGHIGKCKSWIIFQSDAIHQIKLVEMITLPRELVFHYYKDDMPHPLADCDVVIGASAGDNFVNKMALRGINAVLTAEADPEKAVADYLNKQVTPPKPRPIGGLVCKVRDTFSSHN
ncbi:Predicted Fe-Mo cluster-binding protein, NifX family [Amphritea atlantica]|uniref:Predicted Fe-Mo cluster-binding protein, NifX family n=1 Tax=Amphritea atlantica TaxID=355243 RepID=A0A1H9D8K1_9GAMM|nr:NifB/NifX family molybdenum-iron cluster-binding protein [Amphritea atlantica]SEQ09796.1 Predicted Fe-Mo cluster-binding protein, NifX family [Amphritea atlantica]